jgi:hypothetical protein
VAIAERPTRSIQLLPKRRAVGTGASSLKASRAVAAPGFAHSLAMSGAVRGPAYAPSPRDEEPQTPDMSANADSVSRRRGVGRWQPSDGRPKPGMSVGRLQVVVQVLVETIRRDEALHLQWCQTPGLEAAAAELDRELRRNKAALAEASAALGRARMPTRRMLIVQRPVRRFRLRVSRRTRSSGRTAGGRPRGRSVRRRRSGRRRSPSGRGADGPVAHGRSGATTRLVP